MESSAKKIALNAVAVGVIAGIVNKYLLGGEGTVNYFGMEMGQNIAVGVASGAGSVVSDLTSEYLIKKMGVSNQVMNGSVLATKAGVGALASSSVLWFAGVLPSEMIPISLAVGASAKVLGDTAYEKILDPRSGFLPF